MGKNGSRRAIVNSHGREVGRLDETPAEPGKQLKLTLDLDLQIAAEEAIEGKNGAIVAMDPHTRRNSGDGEPADFRSQRFRGEDFTRRVEQAGQRSRQAAAEQSDSGAACARLDVQDHHGDRGVAGRDCPDPPGELQRGRDVLWPAVWMLGEKRPRRSRHARRRSISPAMSSFIRWRKSSASIASQNTPPCSAWGKRPGSTCPTK